MLLCACHQAGVDKGQGLAEAPKGLGAGAGVRTTRCQECGARLTPQEIEDIAGYVASLGGGTPLAEPNWALIRERADVAVPLPGHSTMMERTSWTAARRRVGSRTGRRRT